VQLGRAFARPTEADHARVVDRRHGVHDLLQQHTVMALTADNATARGMPRRSTVSWSVVAIRRLGGLWETSGMTVPGDTLRTWLVELVASPLTRWLGERARASGQERALRAVGRIAIDRTAAQLALDDAEPFARVVGQVFDADLPTDRATPDSADRHATLLEALGVGMAARLAVLSTTSSTAGETAWRSLETERGWSMAPSPLGFAYEKAFGGSLDSG
jgi:hypothetical protein